MKGNCRIKGKNSARDHPEFGSGGNDSGMKETPLKRKFHQVAILKSDMRMRRKRTEDIVLQ